MKRIQIDPNLRTQYDWTIADWNDVVDGTGDDLVPDEPVEVFESESGLTGSGTVIDLNRLHGLIYVDVDWSSLRINS